MKILTTLFALIFLTNLYSEEWLVRHQDETLYLTDVCFINDIVGMATAGNKVLMTTDGGQTWESKDLSFVVWSRVNVLPDSGSFILCGSNGKLGKYKNGVLTELNSGTTKNLSGVAFANGKIGYAVGEEGTFLKTTDGGNTWISKSTVTQEWFNNVIVSDSDNVVIVCDNGTVKTSNDGGNTLNNHTIPGINSFLGDAAFVGPNDFWVGGSDGTLFRVTPNGYNIFNTNSTDGIMGLAMPTPEFGVGVGDNGAIYEYEHETWDRKESPTNNYLNSVTFKEDTGKGIKAYTFWAVGEKGIILSKTVNLVNVNEPTMPNNYFVSNNYPNPFNPSTKFDYSIPYSSMVNIELYNMLGEKIAIIKNETETIGKHNISIDGNNISSGVYFVKFNFKPIDNNVKEYSTTKKILLMK